MTQPPVAPVCYRHPDRQTYVGCQRCGRPICGECMISASVGFQCPECVRQGARETRQNEGPFGGERSKNPALTSIVLIGINVAVWLAITLTGGNNSMLVRLLALAPDGRCWSVAQPGAFYPDATTAALCQLVGGDGLWQPGALSGAWWQLITSGFTHVEILHIGMNMLALWFLGPPLEQALGRARFLAVYFISLLAGSASVLWFADPNTFTLGASGAIFGLIGALLVLTIKVGGDVRTVLIWLGINVAYTFIGSGISWQGHLGGLVGGLAASAIIAFAPRQNRTTTQWAGLAALGAAVVAMIGARMFLG